MKGSEIRRVLKQVCNKKGRKKKNTIFACLIWLKDWHSLPPLPPSEESDLEALSVSLWNSRRGLQTSVCISTHLHWSLVSFCLPLVCSQSSTMRAHTTNKIASKISSHQFLKKIGQVCMCVFAGGSHPVVAFYNVSCFTFSNWIAQFFFLYLCKGAIVVP